MIYNSLQFVLWSFDINGFGCMGLPERSWYGVCVSIILYEADI